MGANIVIANTVEIYPPKGFNSAEVGLIYKGISDESDIITLLLYLANKGYIKISKLKFESSFGLSMNFSLSKLKNYDGDSDIESLFLDGLFKNSYVVTTTDLIMKFYITLDKITNSLNKNWDSQKLFRESYMYRVLKVSFQIKPKRTKYGNEVFERIDAFKRFVETVRTEKLEEIVLREQTYFYDVLPYAYALNFSERWINLFEKINLRPPDWYESKDTFSVVEFGHFIDDTMISARFAMSLRKQNGVQWLFNIPNPFKK